MPILRLAVLSLLVLVMPAAPGFTARLKAAFRSLAPLLTHGPLSDTFGRAALSPDWSIHNGSLADISVAGGALRLEPTATGGSNIWFDNAEGPLVYKEVTGDFTVRARVHAVQSGNPSQPPAPSFRLGGLLVRNPASVPGNLNWVHVAFGAGNGAVPLTVEDKSTVGSVSDWIPHPAPATEGWLRIKRVGSLFRMSFRPFGASGWTALREFDRPDMPATVQVGAMAYSLNAPSDLLVSFDEILID